MKYQKFILTLLLCLLFLSSALNAQVVRVDEVVGKSDPGRNRSRGLGMLKGVKDVLEEFYYDKNYRGIDIDQRFKEAAEKIKTLDTNAEIFKVIAGVVMEFKDSHTQFYPPSRSNRVEYGFSMQMIGDRCLVVNVKKGSDAEKQGVKIGDQVVKIGQYQVTRGNLWVLNYYLYSLEPLPVLPITVAGPDGKERTVGVEASFRSLADRKKEAAQKRKEKRENPYKCSRISADVTACKLRTFSVDKKFIDQMMREAVQGSKLILDLRGNRGGYVKMEEYLTGHFFDREVKIADMVSRKKTDTRMAKPVKDSHFNGELIVLIDSDSASASEVFARVIQLEKRGKIVGDVSAGAVMTSYGISLSNSRGVPGYETLSFYGMNVTVADVIMSDGQRLENIGVLPDHPVGPTGVALAQRNDPVLAFAADLLGARISSDDAGKLEFLFKKSEDDVDEESEDDAAQP
jgi:C-terminal processing protease CtpA/Prc